jgi:hypothetical protein
VRAGTCFSIWPEAAGAHWRGTVSRLGDAVSIGPTIFDGEFDHHDGLVNETVYHHLDDFTLALSSTVRADRVHLAAKVDPCFARPFRLTKGVGVGSYGGLQHCKEFIGADLLWRGVEDGAGLLNPPATGGLGLVENSTAHVDISQYRHRQKARPASNHPARGHQAMEQMADTVLT